MPDIYKYSIIVAYQHFARSLPPNLAASPWKHKTPLDTQPVWLQVCVWWQHLGERCDDRILDSVSLCPNGASGTPGGGQACAFSAKPSVQSSSWALTWEVPCPKHEASERL